LAVGLAGIGELHDLAVVGQVEVNFVESLLQALVVDLSRSAGLGCLLAQAFKSGFHLGLGCRWQGHDNSQGCHNQYFTNLVHKASVQNTL
jgi:hypothetical protein